MSVVTAQILAGHPDSSHAGIWPTHDEGVHAAAPRSLDDSPMSIEVCASRYARGAGGWKRRIVRRGSL